MSDEWFGDTPVIGEMSREDAFAKLEELGEPRPEDEQPGAATFGRVAGWFSRDPRPWQHTAHAFGFIAASADTHLPLPVVHAGAMAADTTLQGSRLRITLDRLRVANYPGAGTHLVLFDFAAQNQSDTGVEHLHFNVTHRALEGEGAAVVGSPIFTGLSVGSEGIAFRCFTVNVKNDDDEKLLAFLESDTFRAGLQLASVAQPALAPLSATAVGLTKGIAKRNRNVAVQDFSLGLDFSDAPFRARLATGSYVAVQIPQSLTSVWSWDDWIYLPQNGELVNREDQTQLIPYNYVVFSITRMAEAGRSP